MSYPCMRTVGAVALLGLVLLFPAAALPAEPLSLKEAVARTLATSPELAEHGFRLRAQQARTEAAVQKPALEFHAQLENALGSGAASGFDSAESTFALSRVIELGDQRQRRMEAAQGLESELQMQQRISQLDVLAEVGRRFIHVASDQRQLELTSLATTLAETTLTEVRRRVETAHSPQVELSRARIALSRAQVEQEHAEHELLTSRRKLAAMWGARSADFEAVDADLFRLPQPGDYDALAARLSSSADFLRFSTEARQREAEIRLAEAKARWAPSVSAGLRRREDRDDFSLVAGVSLPLFAARRAEPAIAEARALHEGIEAAEHTARVRAEASLFELLQELRHSITEAQVLRDEVLPEMEAALQATEYAWRRGRYGYLEWTEAQRERIGVQRALIEAAANAHLFQVEIERLTGAAATDETPR